jgi:serine/threonine protein kinase
MFINEAKIAAELTHPNVAQVYELGEVAGEYFMALEYVKGQDLLHVLRYLAKNPPEKRALPPDVAAYVAREICRGLAHAHDHADDRGNPRPIVHRDVSPQNIMLGYDGQVKIVDFGIAKAMFTVRDETRSGALKGKIAYMSPEQVTGTNPGPESDVFSAGVVLYEMLIGRRLFKGQNDFDTLSRVKSMPIPAPSRVANWVPPQLDVIVMKALERDRAQRYKRASSMARDLDEYLQSMRFSLEQMNEWMRAVFPPEKREEIPEVQGARTPDSASTPSQSNPGSGSRSRSGSRSGQSSPSNPAHPQTMGMTNPGTPRAIASAGSYSGSRPPGGASRRVLIVAVAAALAIGFGGALLAVKGRDGKEPNEVAAPSPAGAIRPLEAGPDLAAPAAVHEPRVEQLPSPPPPEPEPEEPRPRKTSVAASPTRTAPQPKPHPTPKKGPKIQTFEDEDAPAPKIQTFDD